MTRFLALGDSYTIGEGVEDQERWPNQLVDLLRARDIAITDLRIIARTAWTTDELADAIDADKPHGSFELVTLMVGVNDQYRSRPVSAFAPEFKNLLKRAKRFAGNRASRVIAISIPDWSCTPYAAGRNDSVIAREIADYNTCAQTLTTELKCRWVDVTELSRDMRSDPTLVAVDGLHPSGAMYERWARSILPVAQEALSGKKAARAS